MTTATATPIITHLKFEPGHNFYSTRRRYIQGYRRNYGYIGHLGNIAQLDGAAHWTLTLSRSDEFPSIATPESLPRTQDFRTLREAQDWAKANLITA